MFIFHAPVGWFSYMFNSIPTTPPIPEPYEYDDFSDITFDDGSPIETDS